MTLKVVGAGLAGLFYGLRGTYGFVGTDTTGPVAGSATGQTLARLVKAKVVPSNIPEGEIVPASGDDDVFTTFPFSATTLANGVIQTQVRDLTFEAVIQGSSVEALGTQSWGVQNPSNRTFQDMWLIAIRRAQSWVAGSYGSARWEIAMIPCNITILGNEFSERTVNPYQYSYNAVKTDVKIWGASYTELSNGVVSNDISIGQMDYPPALTVFKGDNSRTAFTLGYTPKAVTRVFAFVNGAQQTYTTHYTVSGVTITFVTAPAQDAIVNVWYEVDESVLLTN